MFFKSKITPDAFADCLVRDHQTIFGMNTLVQICTEFDLHFRDEASSIEAFYELQTFGLYAIADGVRQCCHDLGETIIANLNQRFATISGPNWEVMCRRVAEYEESGNHAPNGGIAAQRIFDRPCGVIQPTSKEAFGLSHVMNTIYLDAVQAVKRLLKQYTIVG